MPASYTIDKTRRLVLSTAAGPFNDGDAMAHMLSLTSDPDFDPTFRQLYDLREVTSSELSGDEMRAGAMMNPWNKGARRAFVCDQDVMFGLARMFEMLTDQGGDQIKVFREIPDALAWLGLDSID